MNLPNLIRSGVKIASRLTASAMVSVDHLQKTAVDSYGPVLGKTTVRQALWEDGQRPVLLPDGTQAVSVAHLTFLSPVPVTSDDRFRLPTMAKGTSLPVLKTSAFMDPAIVPYLTEVWLGVAGSGVGVE